MPFIVPGKEGTIWMDVTSPVPDKSSAKSKK
jgi:hypothetical protein